VYDATNAETDDIPVLIISAIVGLSFSAVLALPSGSVIFALHLIFFGLSNLPPRELYRWERSNQERSLRHLITPDKGMGKIGGRGLWLAPTCCARTGSGLMSLAIKCPSPGQDTKDRRIRADMADSDQAQASSPPT
jgi:hypothetical protein